MILESNNQFNYGVWFNGHHSTEFGLDVLNGKEITFPSKKKIMVQPPFSNQQYDFSNVYGGQVFEERTFTIVFNLIDRDNTTKESLYRMFTQVVNWLMSAPTKQPLYDDIMKKYYYLAEVVNEPDFNELLYRGELTVEWVCYPFRIYELAEGNDVWDTFDFELDVAQATQFDVQGSKTITLLNAGESITTPKIRTNAPFTIAQGATSFQVPIGTSTSTRLRLLKGENRLTITGNGSIEFIWHKELI